MKRLSTWLVFALSLIFFSKATVIGSTAYNNYCNTVDQHLPKSCLDFRCLGFSTNGVYTIYPTEDYIYSIKVYCDQTTDGGGWTVFQRRMNGLENFYRNWKEYQIGFGEVDEEHWLGNDIMDTLTTLNVDNELRVDLEDFDNVRAYALYSTFDIGDELSNYVLAVGGYSGNAGDSLISEHGGMQFSTNDYDNDVWYRACAVTFKGAWWYQDCHHSNLNGKYFVGGHHLSSYADGINWYTFRGHHYSMKISEMKFRKQV